jgi:mRNA interferase MazF
MNAGDVVISTFPGVETTKRRPSVIVSTASYHAERPDVILALITTNVSTAIKSTDYVLQDWFAAGLKRPSAVRIFLFTLPTASVMQIGKLSDRDWLEVRNRLQIALNV